MASKSCRSHRHLRAGSVVPADWQAASRPTPSAAPASPPTAPAAPAALASRTSSASARPPRAAARAHQIQTTARPPALLPARSKCRETPRRASGKPRSPPDALPRSRRSDGIARWSRYAINPFSTSSHFMMAFLPLRRLETSPVDSPAAPVGPAGSRRRETASTSARFRSNPDIPGNFP